MSSDPPQGSKLLLHLFGGEFREGTIALSELASIASNMQDLVLRLARAQSGRSGPGRTPTALDRATQLVLVAMHPGSTVLEIEPATAQIELPLEGVGRDAGTEAIGLLVQGVSAVARSQPLPQEFTPSLVESTKSWFRSLAEYDEVSLEVSGISQAPTTLRFSPGAAVVQLLQPVQPREAGEPGAERAIEGSLYAVNLHTNLFRIEDDLGRSITCHLTEEVEDVGRLLGERVRASGEATVDERGRIHEFQIESLKLAAPAAGIDRERFFESSPLAELLASATPVGSLRDLVIDDLTDDESARFLEALAGL